MQQLVGYIGIDPGSLGGAVINYYRTNSYESINLGYREFPFEDRSREEILDWFRGETGWFSAETDSFDFFAVIEQIPYAIFGTSKSSMSKLYGSFAELRMILISCGIPYKEIPSTKWVHEFMKPKSKDETTSEWKGRHRDVAKRLLKIAVSKDMADAYLLSEYCRRLQNEGLQHEAQKATKAPKKKTKAE